MTASLNSKLGQNRTNSERLKKCVHKLNRICPSYFIFVIIVTSVVINPSLQLWQSNKTLSFDDHLEMMMMKCLDVCHVTLISDYGQCSYESYRIYYMIWCICRQKLHCLVTSEVFAKDILFNILKVEYVGKICLSYCFRKGQPCY